MQLMTHSRHDHTARAPDTLDATHLHPAAGAHDAKSAHGQPFTEVAIK